MPDRIHRWITEEGTIRILSAVTTDSAKEASKSIGTSPEATRALANMLTGGALLQLALAPADRMQFHLQHRGSVGEIVSDVRPGVFVRASVQEPNPDVAPFIGGMMTINVSRYRVNGGELFESLVEVPDADISSGFQLYSLQSEQVLSFVAMDCLMSNWDVDVSGGILVQALPGLKHEELEAVTQCLEKHNFSEILRLTNDPVKATETIFADLKLHELGVDPLAYKCTCSKDRVLGALVTLGIDELEEIKAEGGHDINCDFCGTIYSISADEVGELIEKMQEEASEAEESSD